MTSPAWKVELYEDPAGRQPFRAFMESLSPYQMITLRVAINTVLARQGHEVCGTEWGKSLGRGLYELRVRRSLVVICQEAGIAVPAGAPAGGKVLLRAFFAVHGDRAVLLLRGYDKGADNSRRRQQKEIEGARRLLSEFRRRPRAHPPSGRPRRRLWWRQDE